MVCSAGSQSLLCAGASPKSIVQGHRQQRNLWLWSSCAVCLEKAVLPPVFVKSFGAQGNNRLVRFDKKTNIHCIARSPSSLLGFNLRTFLTSIFL